MHPNAQLIDRFYTAFGNRNAAGMVACYHPDIAFSDEVFPDLKGARAGGMWQMLCERGKDLTIEVRDIAADDLSGQAHWEARYTFSATGRKVHNSIDATFTFRDGKIIRHQDVFSFWRWASQALGPKGLLLGWSGAVRKRVRARAAQSLDAYMRRGDTSVGRP